MVANDNQVKHNEFYDKNSNILDNSHECIYNDNSEKISFKHSCHNSDKDNYDNPMSSEERTGNNPSVKHVVTQLTRNPPKLEKKGDVGKIQ